MPSTSQSSTARKKLPAGERSENDASPGTVENGANGSTGSYSTSISNGDASLRRSRRSFRSLSSPSDPPAPPRRSSTIQDMQELLKEQVLQPTGTPDTASHWNTIPLAFAMLPAVAGVFFNNGSVFVTDVILLFLTAVFLHWLIKFPWEWYHESQSLRFDPDPYSAIIEEEDEDEDDDEDDQEDKQKEKEKKRKKPKKNLARSSAERELQFNQHAALVCCFIGPALGGWLLHTIRTQLSRPGETLLSTFNISVFVLGAGLRPSAQVIKLIRERCAYLHTVVHHPPPNRVDEIGRRVNDLEGEMQQLIFLYTKLVDQDLLGSVKKGIQPDLDALNRAVRRYEKKEAAKSIETETRFGELDRRLNDVLTLAAAAHSARNQQPFYVFVLEWVLFILAAPFIYGWKLLSLPARVVETVAGNVKKSQALLGKHGRAHNTRPRQLSEGRHRSKSIKARSQ